MNANELLDRYIHEVGQHLPKKMRADVQLEMRSLLEDLLEERAEEGNHSRDEIAMEVVREFGKPEAVAARYSPPGQLIGPNYFPAYIVTLKIVLICLGGLFLTGFAIALARSESPAADVWPLIAKLIGNLLNYAILNFGLITFVFAILERLLPHRADTPETWDPRALPEVKDPHRIDRMGLIANVIATLIFLIVLNSAPYWTATIHPVEDGNAWELILLIAPEFWRHLPWLTASGLLEIGLNLMVIRRGRWNRPLRWAELGSSLLSGVVLYRIIANGPVLISSGLTLLAKVFLGFVLMIVVLEAIGQLYRLITHDRLTYQTLRAKLLPGREA